MNYVFFYPDEMRADSLACYGNPTVRTPNYDRLANEGVLFEQNYTQHPVCVPSRCSLMTGWYPHVEGFRTLRNFLQPHHPNFFRYLKEAGFEIHLYGKNHVFSDETFKECIDVWKEQTYESKDSAAGIKLKSNDYTMLFDAMPDDVLEEISDTKFVNIGTEVIKNRKEGDKPFFLFLPLFYPHAPYSITEEFHNMYDPNNLPPLRPSDLEGKPRFHKLIRKYRKLDDTEESVFRKIQAVYLGMVSYTDMLLGRILDALDESGLSEDTTIIVCSDHGDWAGDYGLVEKWPNAFDDTIVKVPLIIRSPGCAAGHRVKELVESIDIMPTVLDMEGINCRHDHFGKSLKAQINGTPGDPSRVVYCEGGYDTREPHCFEGTEKFKMFMSEDNIYYPKMIQQQKDPESVCRGTMMRTTRYKLIIRSNGENELYDLKGDPKELKNLYNDPAYKDTVSDLQQQMLTWFVHSSDVVPWENHK